MATSATFGLSASLACSAAVRCVVKSSISAADRPDALAASFVPLPALPCFSLAVFRAAALSSGRIRPRRIAGRRHGRWRQTPRNGLHRVGPRFLAVSEFGDPLLNLIEAGAPSLVLRVLSMLIEDHVALLGQPVDFPLLLGGRRGVFRPAASR
jgi:hypothetical protein